MQLQNYPYPQDLQILIIRVIRSFHCAFNSKKDNKAPNSDLFIY